LLSGTVWVCSFYYNIIIISSDFIP
jgi:hypothetical protein